jgi:hypothetical protein
MTAAPSFYDDIIVQDYYSTEGYATAKFDWGYYEGHFSNGKASGFGVQNVRRRGIPGGLPNDELARYRGDWKDGKRDGYGRLEIPWDNGKVYEGGWINGRASGYGKISTIKKGWVRDWEEGGFKEGYRHGWGATCLTTPSNETIYYTGGFKEGERHGYYVKSSGTTENYRSVRKGILHGYQIEKRDGVLISREFFLDGRSQQQPRGAFNSVWLPSMISFSPLGTRYHDRTHAVYASATSVNGDSYVGNLSYGCPHGFGTLYRPRSHQRPGTYDGGWKHGYACGYGVWNGIDGIIYEGGWLDGTPHGYGKFTSGGTVLEVFFENGTGWYFETTLMLSPPPFMVRGPSPLPVPFPTNWSL